MSAEEWRWIPGFEGRYEISSLGAVRSWLRCGRGSHIRRAEPVPMSVRVNDKGYLAATLTVAAGRPVPHQIHRLLALAFIGPPPEGADVRHIDGNPTNNQLSNLAYGSRAQNILDQVRHGTHKNAKKTHCDQGHLFDAANTYVDLPRHRRQCRACSRARRIQRAARRAAAA